MKFLSVSDCREHPNYENTFINCEEILLIEPQIKENEENLFTNISDLGDGFWKNKELQEKIKTECMDLSKDVFSLKMALDRILAIRKQEYGNVNTISGFHFGIDYYPDRFIKITMKNQTVFYKDIGDADVEHWIDSTLNY